MRVLVADDQAGVRSALRLLLEHEGGIEIMAEAADAAAVLQAAGEQSLDVVLLDWELPGRPAANLIDGLRALCPNVRVVAMSCQPEARRTARAAHVDAFVDKCDPPERLLAVLQGMRIVSTRSENSGDELSQG